MGCVASAPEEKEGNNKPIDSTKNPTDKVANQRRRLSVAPGQVGDIDLAAQAAAVTTEDNDKGASVQTQFYVTAFRSKKGFVPYNNRKQNQDSYIVHENIQNNPDISLYGVFDGHGEVGEQVSGYCRDNFPAFFEAENILDNPVQAIMQATAKLCQAIVLHTPKINLAFSGTTAVYALRIGRKFYVANIGDSRCIVTRKGSNGLDTLALSNDHKPDLPVEKERILAAGGRVQPLQGLPDEDCGPCRVWLKETDVPGLAMSRSIGDEISHRVGVIDIPEIIEYEMTDKDLFVVWASDGVWEFLSNEEVAKIVSAHAPRWDQSVSALIDAANTRWKEEEEVIDDITTVIFGFNAGYQ